MKLPVGLVTVQNEYTIEKGLRVEKRIGGVCWRWRDEWHGFMFHKYGGLKSRYVKGL